MTKRSRIGVITLLSLASSYALPVLAADSWSPPSNDYVRKMVTSAGYTQSEAYPTNKIGRKTTLKVYTFFGGTGLTTWQYIAKEFRKYQPNVKVEFVSGDWNTYVDKAYAMISAGSAPDVIFCENGMAPFFIGNNLLLPMDRYIKASKFKSVLDDYAKPAVSRYSMGGSLYAIPTDNAAAGLLFYNKKLIAEAGLGTPPDKWSWEEFIPYIKKMTIPGKRDGFELNSDRAFIHSYGGEMSDNDSRPAKFTFNSDKAMKGLQMGADLILKHKVMRVWWSKGNPGDAFKQEKLAMLSSGIWDSPDAYTFNKFDFDVTMLPSGDGGVPRVPTGGTGIGIVKGTKSADAAWEFVKFACGPVGQCITASGGGQPVLKRLFNTDLFARNEVKPLNKRILWDLAENARYMPFSRMYRQYDPILNTALGQVWAGKLSVKQAVDSALPPMQRLLEAGNRKK